MGRDQSRVGGGWVTSASGVAVDSNPRRLSSAVFQVGRRGGCKKVYKFGSGSGPKLHLRPPGAIRREAPELLTFSEQDPPRIRLWEQGVPGSNPGAPIRLARRFGAGLSRMWRPDSRTRSGRASAGCRGGTAGSTRAAGEAFGDLVGNPRVERGPAQPGRSSIRAPRLDRPGASAPGLRACGARIQRPPQRTRHRPHRSFARVGHGE